MSDTSGYSGSNSHPMLSSAIDSHLKVGTKYGGYWIKMVSTVACDELEGRMMQDGGPMINGRHC